MDEMHHAEWLSQHIIFLEGMPVVNKLNPMKIGTSVLEMVSNDQDAELAAVRADNAAIRLAYEVDDQATADLLTKIVKMEEAHVDWAEKQRAQMGLENYLTDQTEGAAG
ncbi:MAG TPA: ferritin-like domain-containing protein [Anaerolineae bacterium]